MGSDRLAPLHFKYSGPISIEQISTGISACIDNALSLFGDASALKQGKRYARALSLCLTSLQEAGKVPILRQMILISPNDPTKWREAWRHFRDHRIKDAFGQSARIVKDAMGSVGEAMRLQLLHASEFAPAREKSRQLGLYVDLMDDGSWWSPRDLTFELVEKFEPLVTDALYRLHREREMGLFSTAALEVFREEYSGIVPDIVIGKEYSPDDFWGRRTGIHGPQKRAWRRLVQGGILKDVPDDLVVCGLPWREWISSDH